MVILDLNVLSFRLLKESKEKKKLEFFGSCTLQAKPVLGENGKLLKNVFGVLTSLSMWISSSHSSNPRLTSHETLIPNNRSVWMRNGSYSWAYALFSPWSYFFDLCRTLHALDVIYSCIYASYINLYALLFVFDLTLLFLFCVSKNPKPHKKLKIQKVWSYIFEHISHVSLV